MTQLDTNYNEIPYPRTCHTQTHPNRLATIGHLFGLQSPAIEKCRYLEIGCACGDNIIPIAYYLPGSEFHGIDLSQKQIETGQKMIQELGLTNVHLHHGSLTDIDHTWGLFDYIVSHGVYSWVPESIADSLLSLSANNLSKNGIAYISYNTYPGWHMRQIIRDMMQLHITRFSDPQTRIEQAKAFLQFIHDSLTGKEDEYELLIKKTIHLLKRNGDAYLFHEYLETHNTPAYFKDFIQKSKKKGLEYLGESDIGGMFLKEFPPGVAGTVDKITGDIIEKEQYADFLYNRSFRQTLLCHKDNDLNRSIEHQAIQSLFISSLPNLQINTSIDSEETKGIVCTNSSGATLKTTKPLLKQSILILQKIFPANISFRELFEQACTKSGTVLHSGAEENRLKKELSEDLLNLFLVKLIELNIIGTAVTAQSTKFPITNPLTTVQIKHDAPVINSRHEKIHLDATCRAVLLLADGNRTEKEIHQQIIKMHQMKPIHGLEKANESEIGQQVENAFEKLKNSALFVQ